jgi:RNA polymerase sigma-70 factor, ECF subfamily
MEDAQRIVELIPRLRRYARAFTGNTKAADDLVQGTLECARAELHLVPPGPDLRVWLYSLMHHIPIADAARPQPAELLPQGDALLPRDLERAVAQLARDQRAVLLLVCTEGLTYDEVARVLGIPVASVVARLSSAREKLRALLGSEAVLRLKAVK